MRLNTRGSDEDLVRGLHIDRRCILVCDRDVVEDDLHLFGICRLNDDGGVTYVPCDPIDSFRIDRNILSVCQCDLRCAACVGCLCQVSFCKKTGSVDQCCQRGERADGCGFSCRCSILFSGGFTSICGIRVKTKQSIIRHKNVHRKLN